MGSLHRLMRHVLPTIAAALAVSGCQSAPQTTGSANGPTLVVLMAVDQLGADLLYGYERLFSDGLRRVLEEGYAFENATHDHAETATAPGHHTLSTGVHPTRHGVVANSWSEREGDAWRSVYSVEDLDRSILGYPDLAGRGPSNSQRSGIADWIVGHDPDARVVSVSRKDRAAIGLAAQARGDVYWLADRGGEFITSDFYHSKYPDWVVRFNSSVMPSVYSQTVWESVVPPEALSASRPDTSRHELDGEHTYFPHRAADLVDASDEAELNHWRYQYTPFPDEAVLAFSRTAIEELDLGQRRHVDFLGISLSQTDLIGHNFGPRSREQLDNLLRLDAELGRFFGFLDEVVGTGQWVLAFSADHGVLDIPELLMEDGVEAARLTRDDRSVYVDALRAVPPGSPESGETLKAALVQLPFVEAAYTHDEIDAGQPADSFAVLYANSHSRARAIDLSSRWGVYTRFSPNVLDWSANRATHGSPYMYDRHVPLIFVGAGVEAGRSTERVATVDAAPTLAELASVPAPDDLDGRVLTSVFERPTR